MIAKDTVQQQAYQYWLEGEYVRASDLYQQIIEAEPDITVNYWYLGLALLLQGKEVEAQVTWMLVMGEGEETQVEQWTNELVEVLETEAQRLETATNYSMAWAIRQHLREIQPSNLNNILRIIELSLKQGTLTGNELTELGVLEFLKAEPKVEVDPDLLLEVLNDLWNKAPLILALPEFSEAALPHIRDYETYVNYLMIACIKIAQNLKNPRLAIALTKIGLQVTPDYPELWRHLASYYQNACLFDKGIEAAKHCYSLMTTLTDQVFANYLLLRGLMNAGGYWEESIATCEKQESLILSLVQEENHYEDVITVFRLYSTPYFFPYFQDNLARNRYIQNQLTQYCQTHIERLLPEQANRYRTRNTQKRTQATTRKLRKIGYISHCLLSHSVGWLARWLFEYQDRTKYDIYGYFINYRFHNRDPLQEWFVDHVTYPRKLGTEYQDIAETIYEDDIDILVDLDSLTLDIASGAIALKPAPVQVTWLGWDASGIPTVDYTIADPYVLPENAQAHYHEKIFRLPQTYIAVDGFEVGVPNLRRDHLDIPSDAVIYLSAQRGYKRHLDTTRLQMRILKEVPNSYFLVKGLADEESIKKFFYQVAEEVGVSCDRLRFLPPVSSEAIHRANLGIADIVLDTFPYNGATTTLETLWMGIPLVTRVGDQFASRNSYTMMVNAGISEGIAWTDEEYVEWGVRLGQDSTLRQQISWRLKVSRQTAPLWNSKQFAREMENAYEQMWQNYLDSH